MIEEKLVPELRFPEFEGEWEKKKLGDTVKLFNGYAFKSKDSKKEGIKWIKIANVGIGEIKWEDESYLPTEYKEKYEDYLLYEGDLIMALTRPILNNEIKLAKMKKQDELALLNQRVGKVIPREGTSDNNFLEYLINLKRTINNIESSILGTDPPNVSKDNFEAVPVIIPLLNEQEKIGNFFSKIDKKIELQEELIENLEKQKKGFMQKIFNQEVRFKDENGEDYPEWEEKKLDDLGDFYNGLRGKNKDYFINGNRKYIQYLNIFQNTIIDNSFNEYDYVLIKEGENQNQVKYGDLLFTQSSETYDEIGMTAVYLSKKEVYLNSFSFGFRFNDTSNINFKYIAYLFESNPMRRKIIKEGQGSTRINLSSNRLKKINLLLPIKEEQNKIASLLSLVDKKGDLAKKELENYKEYKKGLMQRMFI